MKAHREVVIAIKVSLIGLLGSAMAAGPLSKQEVTTLISGSKVTHRGVRETGTWEVNANGQLCVTWQGKNQPNCQYLVPTAGGGYNLT